MTRILTGLATLLCTVRGGYYYEEASSAHYALPLVGESRVALETNRSAALVLPPSLHPPSFLDPSDPPALSFDPVANWIRLTERNQAKLSLMINSCLKTICRDYMHECHWYCDPMKGIAERRWLCDECLGPYIRLCGKCFEA